MDGAVAHFRPLFAGGDDSLDGRGLSPVEPADHRRRAEGRNDHQRVAALGRLHYVGRCM